MTIFEFLVENVGLVGARTNFFSGVRWVDKVYFSFMRSKNFSKKMRKMYKRMHKT